MSEDTTPIADALCARNTGGISPAECTVPLPCGGMLVAPRAPDPCSYVRVIDRAGQQVLRLSSAEWRARPELAIGALVGALEIVAAGGTAMTPA